MNLTAQILLKTTDEQDDALKRTLRLTNACCDYMSQVAFEKRKFGRFALQKLAYRDMRDKFPTLSAQVIIRALAKVSDAYALDRNTLRTFKSFGAISYDVRILSFNLDRREISIWSVDGRLKIPFACGERQWELLQGKRGEADLCYIDGRFYLFVSCKVDEPAPKDIGDILGIDLGIVNLATDSDGETYSGEAVEDNRQKFAHRRRNLQRKGTKAAKRKLKRLSGKQARHQKDTNHIVSKAVVSKAQRTERGIALEILTGIRERVRARRKQRGRLHNWSFHQLKTFIIYKARRLGVPIFEVDPRNTSRECPRCGCIDKRNRPSQNTFLCVSCGFSAPADTNAARNIRARVLVNVPNGLRAKVSTIIGQGQAPMFSMG